MWKVRLIGVFALAAVGWFAFCLPSPLFAPKYATVVFDNKGQLIGARTALDEQWRFPPGDSLPKHYEQAMLLFEDEWFHYHPGVNPVSFAKAIWQNAKSWEIQRGGSTIAMQVVRLSRGNPKRTLWEKFLELFRAIRLELSYSKNEILNLYAAHAPFGGNIVGVEAAAWRYFGQPLHQLSVAEYATLAVLPNAPSWIRPGKNTALLEKRRNRLLEKMYNRGFIDSTTFELGCAEPLPNRTYALPQEAYHLVTGLHQTAPGKRHVCTLDKSLQTAAEQLILRHGKQNAANQIHNAALLIADVASGALLAYVGNVPTLEKRHSPFVDIATAPRSSGSTLKTFLYAASLERGVLAPNTLLPDIPIIIDGFRPRNFNNSFDGAVAASEALSRSLNIPMVKLLQQYHVAPFLENCNAMGFRNLNKSAEHYGLSLILGGGEVSLFELTAAYGYMAQRIHSDTAAIQQLHTVKDEIGEQIQLPFGRESAWWTAEALRTAARPDEEQGWEYFAQPNIAWKTGTSYGFRDAWAIGFSANYVVGVWVGNATGEGRPGLIGGKVAAPILFEAFGLLPSPKWFEPSVVNAKKVQVCSSSGEVAHSACRETSVQFWPETAREKPCPYHKTVWLNTAQTHRVRRECFTDEMTPTSFFVLPSAMAFYYRQRHSNYRDLPPWWPNCASVTENTIQIIYPELQGEVLLPRDRDGQPSPVVLKAAHQHSGEVLFWDINGHHHTTTQWDHSIAVILAPGSYTLTVTDELGNSASRVFQCL